MSGTPYVSKKKASMQLGRYEDIGFGVTSGDEDSMLMQDRKKSYDAIPGGSDDEETGHGHGHGGHHHKELSPHMKMFHTVKIVLIASFFIATILVFMFQHSHDEHPLSDLHGVSSASPLLIILDHHYPRNTVKVTFTLQQLVNQTNSWYPNPTVVTATIQGASFGIDPRDNVTHIKIWTDVDLEPFQLAADPDSMITGKHYFYIDDDMRAMPDLRINVSTNSAQAVGMKFHYLQLGGIVRLQVLWGMLILILVYTLIVFELVHRTIAALLGSFWALAVLSVVQERPAFLEVVSWIDYNTIGLLFGMMLMVGIFSTTGFFEWSAVRAYKLSNGDIWRLVVMLCIFTAVASMFLDNVTTILLVAPVTLRLCRVIDLDPLPIILAEVIFSNIGGTATGIGDPPNILIISNIDVVRSGVADFTAFSVHVGPGAILGLITTMFFIKWYCHDVLTKRQPKSAAMKEIEIWKRTAIRIQTYSEEEKFVKDKLLEHIQELETEAIASSADPANSNIDISELEEKYVITDYPLFYKCVIVLVIVVMLFFLHPFVHAIQLTLPWIAIIGSMALLTISGIEDFQEVIEKVEMATLLFFGGLFVLMRCIEEMEVMEFIAHHTAEAIATIPAGRVRLGFSVVMIMWVCAIVSALIDNIPFTQTMIPIVVRISKSGLGLPLAPLLWSLAFGACLGGNGTLIGASANVVAAGIAEQQGYPISFLYFFRIASPCMVVSMITATIYMVITHVFIPWY